MTRVQFSRLQSVVRRPRCGRRENPGLIPQSLRVAVMLLGLAVLPRVDAGQVSQIPDSLPGGIIAEWVRVQEGFTAPSRA